MEKSTKPVIFDHPAKKSIDKSSTLRYNEEKTGGRDDL